MKRFDVSGFTIVETMLFLAITGMLVVGILVGTGASIANQRYSDSVTSLQSVLKEQYSEVSSVNNSRDNSWACSGASGLITEVAPGSGTNRGQSDCVILGRLITSSSDGKSINIRDVVGSEPANMGLMSSDVEALSNYNIKVSPIAGEVYETQWGSYLVEPDSEITSIFSVLILSSPLSGVIRTFINPDLAVADDDVDAMVSTAALSESFKVCIDSAGSFSGVKSAVIINAGASSGNDVETLGSNSGC